MRTPFTRPPAFALPWASLSCQAIRGRSGGSGFFTGRFGGGGVGAGAGAGAAAARATAGLDGPPSSAASGTSAATSASRATQAQGPRPRRRARPPTEAAQAGQQWSACRRADRGRVTAADANKSRGISVQSALWTARVDASPGPREYPAVTGALEAWPTRTAWGRPPPEGPPPVTPC